MHADEYRAQLGALMSEDTLQAQVEALARTFGWLVYHTHDSRRSPSGFPDLCMVRGGRLIFAELKSAKGRLLPDQDRWLSALGGMAVDLWADQGQDPVQVYLWRPANMLDGTIERVLR